MKLKSLIMFSAAALAFAACSNEEENAMVADGTAAVQINLVQPGTRTVGDATTEEEGTDKVKVTGNIHVRITDASGAGQDIELNAGTTTYTFYGINNPTKVEAWVNDGDDISDATTLAQVNTQALADAPETIPAYGAYTGVFTLTDEERLNSTDGKVYKMYQAVTVNLEIPVARLEVSGIVHNDESEDCIYTADGLTFDAIYLDNVKATKGATNATDYYYPVDDDRNTTEAPVPVLMDLIEAPANNFQTEGAVWPAVEDPAQAYVYHFFPNNANEMPLLKLCFEKVVRVDGTVIESPRYAIVKSFNGKENFEFKAGVIYRITDVQIADKNIGPKEEHQDEDVYAVDVTVVEAAWDIENLEAAWQEY